MKIAIPVWSGRVSPVFDVSTRVVVVRANGGTVCDRQEFNLPEAPAELRIAALRQAGVGKLVCCGISCELKSMLHSGGIEVVCNVCGGIDEVLDACAKGNVGLENFVMPGCRRRNGRLGGRCRRGRRNCDSKGYSR